MCTELCQCIQLVSLACECETGTKTVRVMVNPESWQAWISRALALQVKVCILLYVHACILINVH